MKTPSIVTLTIPAPFGIRRRALIEASSRSYDVSSHALPFSRQSRQYNCDHSYPYLHVALIVTSPPLYFSGFLSRSQKASGVSEETKAGSSRNPTTNPARNLMIQVIH